MNHHYGDMSNLNAPYDAYPLQGMGQLIEDHERPDDPKYPWKQFSQHSLVLQSDINEFLTFDGSCLIDEDGKLGPKTCGAMRYAQEKGVIGSGDIPQTCVAHAHEEAQPRPTSPPCPTGVPSPSPAPGPVPEDPEQVKTGGGIPGWAIGLGLGVVAIGIAFALKKKRR